MEKPSPRPAQSGLGGIGPVSTSFLSYALAGCFVPIGLQLLAFFFLLQTFPLIELCVCLPHGSFITDKPELDTLPT